MPTIFKPASQREAEAYSSALIAKTLGAPPPQPRLIDDLVLIPRNRPMKVLCLGMSRTGTFSLFTALTMLGYNPYHMAAALMNAPIEFPCWKDALEAKYFGKGKPWGREEFDKIMGDYDSLLDIPALLFAEELLAAYPEAKVILTERPLEDWMKSIKDTIGAVLRWNWFPVSWADPGLVGPFFNDGLSIVDKVVPFSAATKPSEAHKLEDFYRQHYAHVRKICPKERLLELRFGMGFKELCEFLGEPVLEQPYPKVNDSAMFVRLHETMWWDAAWKAVTKITTGAVLAGIGGVVLARGMGYAPAGGAMDIARGFVGR